jgi:transforming growth factor-beta-induced protein
MQTQNNLMHPAALRGWATRSITQEKPMVTLARRIVNVVVLLALLFGAVASAGPAYAADATTYTVKRGDNLSRIARSFVITLEDLKAANNLKSDVIQPGQVLVIPNVDIVGRAAGARTFKTLLAAAQAAGLVDALKGPGPLTVFAPTDAAFAKLGSRTISTLLANPDLLRKVLLYHVVPGKVMAADVVNLASANTLQGSSVAISVAGGKVKINNATVTATDIGAANGVIHVIDSVILPPLDLVDTAILNGNFTTLVAAVKAAGLESALRAAGPYTVFAPTDAAFRKLPAGTVAALLKDPAALSNILLYHVVSGKVMAADVVTLSAATTLQGAPVAITVANGKVKVNNANVVLTDVAAANGVIHVIDTVILPPQ